MPQPPEIDALGDELVTIYRQVVESVEAQLDGPLSTDPRAWRSRRRLQAIQARTLALLDEADDQARRWLEERFPGVYGRGGALTAEALGEGFAWTQPHIEAVRVLAADTFDDLLAATQHMRESIKATIRRLSRAEVRAGLLEGVPAQAGARRLRDTLLSEGLASVTYRNGAVVGIDAYSELVVRTKSAVAYNQGTLNQGAQMGVAVYEVFDGANCGWTEHNDPDGANGSFRTAEECLSWPISHPNCRRSFGPRPDLQPAQAAQAAPSTTKAQRADQAAYEAFLAEQRAATPARRTREPRQPRQPRHG